MSKFNTKLKLISIVLSFVGATSCGPNQRILQSSATPTPEVSSTSALMITFDQEVEAMRTANFNFIYVFRRKDAAVMDAADKRFAAERIPVEMNRRKLIDGGRAIIIGSNFFMPPENMELLLEKFTLAEFSRPENAIIDANANTGNR